MKKSTKIILAISISALVIYGGFLIKKSFVDKGYSSQDEEKDFLLGNYLIMLGIPDTKANRRKYSYMTIEALKKELGIDDSEVAPEEGDGAYSGYGAKAYEDLASLDYSNYGYNYGEYSI